MDLIISLKAFFLGIIWAGSFYLTMAYILPIFPMPALLYIRKRLELWSDNIAWLDEAKAKKRWMRAKGFFKFLVAVLWLALMALCAYLLLPLVGLIVPQEQADFWLYYGIAAALPALFGLYWGIDIFRDAAKSTQVEALKEDERPALERIKQPLV